MTACRTRRFRTVAAAIAAGVAAAGTAAAQDVSLNFENLSSMEEPLAAEFGDMTFVLSGLLDTRAALVANDEESSDAGLIGNFQVDALAQLPNRWRLGLVYFGQLETDGTPGSEADDEYTDNAALSVGGVWGTVLAGDISGVVREQTRRLRGAGNSSLAFDDMLGERAERGGGYLGRFGPWVLGAVADEDSGFELGAMFQRPIDDKDYRWTARVAEGVYTAADGRRFDSRLVAGVGELVYGSTLYDVGVGYERFESRGPDVDRWYVSSGVRRKIAMLSLSIEGHYGRIEDDEEISASIGIQYDIARGLSVNLGLNVSEASVAAGGGSFLDADESNVIVSLRYSF